MDICVKLHLRIININKTFSPLKENQPAEG